MQKGQVDEVADRICRHLHTVLADRTWRKNMWLACRQNLHRTYRFAGRTSRYDMQTEHADKLCTRNHAEEIHVCRLNPHTNYTTRRCRQIMQTGKYRKNMQTNYACREKIRRTCSQDKQTKNMQTEQVDKLCRQNMHTLHRPSQTFATFFRNRHKCVFSVILKNKL